MVEKLKAKKEACNAKIEALVAEIKKEQAKCEVIDELIREFESEEAEEVNDAPVL